MVRVNCQNGDGGGAWVGDPPLEGYFQGWGGALRLLNAPNSEDGGLKVRFSLATIAFDRESAQMLSNTIVATRKGKTHLQTPILTT